MKFIALILLAVCCCLPACSFRSTKKYHTAAVAPPSVDPVRRNIASASAASAETSRHISSIRRGADRVDYKAGRALEFFLDAP